MNNNCCVYKHTTPNGKVYIGFTTQKPELRWGSGHGYDTQFFGKAVRKYGWENIKHEILESGLTAKQAKAKEIEYIKMYNSKDPACGYNCTDGGDGCNGRNVTEAERKIRSNTAKKMWSNEEKRKILLEHLQKISKENIGRRKTKDQIEKTKVALSVPVSQYTLDGEYVKTYKSVSDAARCFGDVKKNSSISSCCKGSKKTCYGYIWKYENEKLGADELSKRLRKDSVEVCQYTTDGVYIRTFNSTKDAADFVGVTYKAICGACSGKCKTCGGFMWRYKNGDIQRQIKPLMPKFKKVLQFDKNGNMIRSYSHANEAEKETGILHISCACQGKRKTAGGYVWKYES